MQAKSLEQVARLAAEQDNVAIATCRLESGTIISFYDSELRLDATVLEGHRFAIRAITAGEALLSWGLPFGRAIKDISPGNYIANESMLSTLNARSISLTLPDEANFQDDITPYSLDEDTFQAARQVAPYNTTCRFQGYPRGGGRGVGTRNYIVLLGTSSLAGSYVKALEGRLKSVSDAYPHLDGIVAVAHTEGGTDMPNNYELVLRTLAGFVVHPNVAAVICIDQGQESINNKALQTYLKDKDYPLEAVPHAFLSLGDRPEETLEEAQSIVRGWLEPANNAKRQELPASELKLALQCGGSDAFSGISGNPLAGWVARELIRHGGSANLAETDELIGAESYVLQHVKSLKVARQFLATVERFKARAAWHGTSAEGNPSGGNKFRGLYNIVLKSIGAANKKDPAVRLDAVLEYGEPMQGGGFYFMDSPGNDLESIAGQVASGCNMIFFVTGNGSITNFPFVPTLKIVTTSERFKLLENDMDINAGAYLDGQEMDALGQKTLERFLRTASGEKSVGERAGHAQVQLWRNWQQTDASKLDLLLSRVEPSGKPIPLKDKPAILTRPLPYHQQRGRLGLILPTSLCSGQVAGMIAERLNQNKVAGLSHFVALSHTEGCGVSGGPTAILQGRTLLNYLRHPLVGAALLLEHGCEKTHNDHMRLELGKLGMNPADYGWASIQLDGGIARTSENVTNWFRQARQVAQDSSPLRLGFMFADTLPASAAKAFADLIHHTVASGNTVVIPSTLLPNHLSAQLFETAPPGSLGYGQFAGQQGFHLMECPTQHWVETLTGLGATGVDLVLTYGTPSKQGHPLLPVVHLEQVTSSKAFLALISDVLSGSAEDQLATYSDFQMTRAELGISM